MREKIQEFLIGLIVIWIVYLVVFVLPTPGSHTAILTGSAIIITVSVVLLIGLRFFGSRLETVRPARAPETSNTTALKSQLESRPQNADLHRTLAREYLVNGTRIVGSVLGNQGVGLGYYEKAEKELLRVLEIFPDDSEALLDLAGTHIRLRKNRQAEQEFLQAIAMKPQKVEYKIVYSRFLCFIKESYYEAETILNKALAQPHSFEMDALIHYSLHSVYARLGNYGRKNERQTYKQNMELEYKKIFPDYNYEKFSCKFIQDKDVAGWSDGVLNGKIVFWAVGPGYKSNTYSKVIEVKRDNASNSTQLLSGSFE